MKELMNILFDIFFSFYFYIRILLILKFGMLLSWWMGCYYGLERWGYGHLFLGCEGMFWGEGFCLGYFYL